MRTQIAAALTLAAIMAFVPVVRANNVMVTDAFARASATPQATSAVAYLTLSNNGAANCAAASCTETTPSTNPGIWVTGSGLVNVMPKSPTIVAATFS